MSSQLPGPIAPASEACSVPRAAGPDLAGFALVTLSAASWGLWSLVLRPTHLPATVTTPILFLVMGIITLPSALRAPPVTWDRATVGLVIANALFDGLNVAAVFAAYSYTTVAIASLTHYLAPVLVALAAPWIDRVATPGARPAALVALIGLMVMLEPWRAPAHGAVLGATLGVVSAVLYAGNVFTVRRTAARIGATRALSYRALIVGLAMAPLMLGHLGEITLPRLALMVAGACTLGAISGVAFSLGLLRIGSARTAVLTFIEPVVAVTVSAAVWREPLHPIAALGGALVLGAGIQVARKAR